MASRRKEREASPYEATVDDEMVDLAQLDQANKLVKVLRVVFTVIGILLLMGALVGIQQKAGLVVALQLSLPVFLLVGVYFMRGQPFGWVLAFAILLTLNTASSAYVTSKIPDSLAHARSIAWIIVAVFALFPLTAWVAAFMLKPVHRLLNEHGGQAAARQFRGNRRKYEGGTAGAKGEARAFKEFQSASTKVLTVGSVALVLLWVGAIGSIWLAKKIDEGNREEERQARDAAFQKEQENRDNAKASFPTIVKSFEQAWAGQDREAIQAMLNPASAKKDMASLAKSLKRFGFDDDKLPSIASHREKWSRGAAGTVKSYWSIPASADKDVRSKLRIEWRYEGGKWLLFDIRLRKTTRDG